MQDRFSAPLLQVKSGIVLSLYAIALSHQLLLQVSPLAQRQVHNSKSPCLGLLNLGTNSER
jgi:hypothetical protein